MTNLNVEDLRRVQVAPGDRFILRTDRALSAEQRDSILQAWRKWTAQLDVPLLVLPHGWDLHLIEGSALERAALELRHG